MRLPGVEGSPDRHGIDDDVVESAADLLESAARVVFAVSGDRTLAEDCAQESLIRAWRRQVGSEEPLRSLEAWTIRVALNLCRSHHRRRTAEARAFRRVVAERPGGPTDGSLTEEVHAAVLALPRRQREVIVLHYLLDMDVATISDVTGITDGAVKNALFNGRSAIAERLSVKEES